MLEAVSLLIRPWQEHATGCTRVVADGVTQAPLGAVRWCSRLDRSWFDWLRSQHCEVLETEDDALLLRLIRPWRLARLWDLYDAEERRVGTIDGIVLLDSEGGRRAYHERQTGSAGRLLDPAAHVLADYHTLPDAGTLLRFTTAGETNPFLRMLLLGCVLIQDLPGRRG